MLVEYKNVSISQGEKEVLKGIDFHVDEGEFVYVIGSVGAGKSTLLKTIYQEVDIDSADKAEVLGRDVATLKRKEVPALRREMGIIFQDFQLLGDRSVYENFKFVLRATGWKDKNEIAKRIEKVLEEVGLKERADSMPHELSGGEQQRIAIARALLNEPKIIIADEPTGNLDFQTAGKIVELLKDITHSGTAVLMTTHNMSIVEKYPGVVYRCEDGVMTDVTNEFDDTVIGGDD